MKNKYYCIECNKEISLNTKHNLCRKCWAKKRMSIPKNNPNFKDGKSLEKYYCSECKEEITYNSKKCIYCENKSRIGINNPRFRIKHEIDCTCCSCRAKRGETFGKNNPNFKGDEAKSRQIYYCIEIDCKNKVSGKDRRCKSCATKKQLEDPKDNPNWKNGITPLRHLIRTSENSENWRTSVFERNNYTCQECGDNKGGNLEVHHIKSFNSILQEFLNQYSQFSPIDDKETLVRLATTYEPFWDINNGITLCRECHNRKHKINQINL
jgi:5-methylcytosine-specific restriction endonuclease McrA